MEVICPRCNGSMEPSEFGGVPVIACSACAGTWIDAGSLHRLFTGEKDAVDLVHALEAIFELDFSESRRNCPRCAGRRLKAVEIENTELDYCLACKGLFFDKGELRRVYPETSYKNGGIGNSIATPPNGISMWQKLKRLVGGGQDPG